MKLKNKFNWLFILLTASVLIFSGCEVEDPTPDCEKHEYGEVTVKNQTGYYLYVDVTWGNIWENYVKRLSNGSSYRYDEVPAGSIEIWASYDNINWSYEIKHLSSCEEMTFRWYDSSKSVNLDKPGKLTLDILIDGEVVETIYDFKTKVKE